MTSASEGTATINALDDGSAGDRYIRGSVFRIVAYALTALMSVAAVPLVISHLGPVRYSYFATASSVVLIAAGFTESGLNAYGLREWATGRPDRVSFLRNLIGLRMSVTGFSIGCAAAGTALIGAPKLLTLGMLASGAGLVLTLAGESYGIPINGDLKLGVAAGLTLIQQLTLTTTYVVLVLLNAGVVLLLAATLLSGLALLLATGVAMHWRLVPIPTYDRSVWWETLKQTAPYGLATAVGLLYFRESLILVSVLSTSKQAGYFAASFKIIEVLTTFPYQLVLAALPILARAAHTRDSDRQSYVSQKLVDTCVLLGAWASLSIVFGGPFGIDVVSRGDHQFAPSVSMLEIQGIAVFASFVVAPYSSILLSMKRFWDLGKANVAALVVVTVLSVALIPSLGGRGASIASVGAEFTLATGYAFYLRRMRPEITITLRSVPRVAAVTAVAGLVTLALPGSSALHIAVFGVLYFGLAAAFRLIPVEILQAARRR